MASRLDACMNLSDRCKAIVAGLSPMTKTFLPSAFIALLLDMCKTLDQLTKEKS